MAGSEKAMAPHSSTLLENPIDGGAWWAAVHGVAKSRTGLSDFTFTFHFHALEKEMSTHSSVLAWRIPGTGEPGGLPSVGLHRVGHDWSDLAAAAAAVAGLKLQERKQVSFCKQPSFLAWTTAIASTLLCHFQSCLSLNSPLQCSQRYLLKCK